jgi:hypothetical protein
MAKINQSYITDIIQTNADGEVLCRQQTTNTSYNLGQEPPYVKLYLDAVLYLSDMPKGYTPILYSIIKRIPWANQEQDMAINMALKRCLAKELDCSVSKISNAITDLVKGYILIRTDVGLYKINPHIFGRGEWKDIGELRLHVTFNAEGKTVMGEIMRKKRKSVIDENQLTLPLPEETNENEYIARAYIS